MLLWLSWVTFQTTESFPAKTRLGYGLAFEDQGDICLNTNSYDAVIEIPMDWFDLANRNHSLSWNAVCTKPRKMASTKLTATKDEFIMCQGIWPLFVAYEHITYARERQIHDALSNEIPVLLPGVQWKIPYPRVPTTERGFSNEEMKKLQQAHLRYIKQEGSKVVQESQALEDTVAVLQRKVADIIISETVDTQTEKPESGQDLWIRMLASRSVVEKLDVQTITEEMRILGSLATVTKNLRAFHRLEDKDRECMTRNAAEIWKGNLKVQITNAFRQRADIQTRVVQARGQDEHDRLTVKLMTQVRTIWRTWMTALVDLMFDRALKQCRTPDNAAKMSEIVEKLGRYQASLNGATATQRMPATGRTRRSLGPINLIWNIVDTFTSHARRRKMTKAIQELQRHSKLMSQEIADIRSDYTVIFRKQIAEVEAIRHDIKETRKHIVQLFDDVAKIQSWTTFATDEIAQLHMADYFLMDVFGQIVPLIEVELDLLEAFRMTSNILIRTLAQLRQKTLSAELIRAHELQALLDGVRNKLKEENQDFTLIFPQASNYYALPIHNFAYNNDSVFVTIPIYMQHFQHPNMRLYRVHSVPVPYGLQETQHQRYTQVRVEKPYLATSRTTFSELTQHELNQCIRQGGKTICPQTSMLRQKNSKTCTMAILDKDSHTAIRQLCEIELLETPPTPDLLDFGSKLIVANIPGTWKFDCGRNENVPKFGKPGPVAELDGNVLCECTVEIGDVRLPKTIDKCDDSTHRTVHTAQNLAVQGYIRTLVRALNEARPDGKPAEPLEWETFGKTIVPPVPGKLHSENGTGLDHNLAAWAAKDIQWQATNQQIQNATILSDESAWWEAIKNPFTWGLFGIVTIIAVIGLVVAVLMCCKLRKLPTVLNLGDDLQHWPDTMAKLKRAHKDFLKQYQRLTKTPKPEPDDAEDEIELQEM